MTPLAVKLRPNNLGDIVGQDHLINIFTKMVKNDKMQNILLCGPPGSGKTTIAFALSNEIDGNFRKLNATTHGIKELRAVIKFAEKQDKKTILIVDEIYRWSKNIQDALLAAVENGTITIIGLTVERIQFAVIKALASRCMTLETKRLDNRSLVMLYKKVKDHYKKQGINVTINNQLITKLIIRVDGDARKFILTLETLIEIMGDNGHVSVSDLDLIMPHRSFLFDATGAEHYDYAQNYQCAIQCSDANSAIYWLAKWLVSGEDPVYIARRLMISSSEDACGNPYAAMIANNAYIAAKEIGYPECSIIMAHATIVIAQSKRCRIANDAIASAIYDVEHSCTIEAIKSNNNSHVSQAGYTKINKKYIDDQI